MRVFQVAFLVVTSAIITTSTACQLTLRASVERSPRSAVIAIRDDVSDFEKWGTRTFSMELMRAAYGHTSYFTEDREKSSTRERRAAFIYALRRALEKYPHVDIFLLAHSNRYIDWVRDIQPALRKKIRLVYNTGCSDSEQGTEWLELGARAYVGHPGDNLAPIFYYYFLPAWARGVPLDEAVALANEDTKGDILNGVAGFVIRAAGGDRETIWRNTEAIVFGDGRSALHARAPALVPATKK